MDNGPIGRSRNRRTIVIKKMKKPKMNKKKTKESVSFVLIGARVWAVFAQSPSPLWPLF
jgi:hypothetical protein